MADLLDDVRQSLLRKLEQNAQALTAATLQAEACLRRQDELMAQLRQLPGEHDVESPVVP